MAQIVIDQKKGLEQFEKYRKKMFPWVETAKAREKDVHRQVLIDAVKQGPLAVRPLHQERARSRLVTRHQATPPTEASKKRLNDLYSRLGKVVPT